MIDTSSYYPEVPGQEGGSGLNNRNTGLFGPERTQTPPPPKTEPPTQPEAPVPARPGLLDAVSHILSWVLSPLLMPVYGLLLAFGLSILEIVPLGMKVYFTGLVFGLDVVLPVLLILLLKRMGLVTDVGLNGRRERLIPYIIMVVCYLTSGWIMAIKGAPAWLGMFFVGGGVAAFVNMLVNFKWKISAHAAGIAGVVALLIRIEKYGTPSDDLLFWLILVILLAGLMGSARVWLGRHTVGQVLAGFAVGFCSVFFLSL